MTGPLTGIRIIEIAGVGPAPFAAMMLADHGAEVVRVERPGGVRAGIHGDPLKDVLARSRRSIVIDLKHPDGVGVVRDLCLAADGLIEGFRPGVMERLGLGPDALLAANPRLVYGRMTGWGQEGPLAQRAGHDINYLALAGNLHTYGRAGEKPTPPINAVADFAGGGMMLAFGMVSAIFHARTMGSGQVIDCAMVDGAALISSMTWALRAMGLWGEARGRNMLDTGAHFYDTYETSDGQYIAVGAIEPAFYAELLRLCGVQDDASFAAPESAATWADCKARLTSVFRAKTRDEWCAVFAGSNACVAPVLSMDEAPRHPHHVERETFIEIDGVMQPAPAPRYSQTPTVRPTMPRAPGADTERILAGLGYDEARIERLREARIFGDEPPAPRRRP
jgi:alpha-methylacyl-CoA racemase